MRRVRALALACLFLGAACGAPTAPPPPPEDLLALENRGIAHLERYEEADTLAAVELLGRVVEQAPTWRDARVNYALALAASRRQDLLARAREEYARVLEEDPTNPHALLGSALLRRFQGQVEEGLPFLARLLQVDPEEASVHFWLGAFEMERLEEDLTVAEVHLRRALALAPDDATAMSALYTVLTRQGHGDSPEALALVERARAIETAQDFGSPALAKHRRRGDKEYGESGPYGRAILDLAPPAGADLGVVQDAGLTREPLGGVPALAVGDVDLDGDDDLFLAGPDGGGRLYRNDGGRFHDATQASGLPDGLAARAALFVDLDGDGLLDLVLAGQALRWWRGAGEGRLEEVPPARLGLSAPGPYVALAATDLDHDGDVDLLLAGASTRYLRNRRDGAFDDVTARKGLGAPDTTSLVAADADGDGITDLVLFRGEGPPTLWRNGRLDPFVPTPALTNLGPARRGTVADVDGDGRLDLVLVRPDGGLALGRGDGRGGFALSPELPTRRLGANAVAVTDLDADGRADLLAIGARTTVLRGLARGHFALEPLRLPEGPREALGLLDADGDGDVDLVLAGPGTPPLLLRNTVPPPRHVLSLRLQGVPDRVEGRTWSNARGLGADVEVKAGDLLLRRVVLAGSGFPGQASDTLAFGLGERARADFVRVRWTDGVLQSEFDVPAGRIHEIVEANRKIASCPVVFAWDGTTDRYVTDALGVGGLGFYAGEAAGYAPPDATEVLRLPALVARKGAFVVHLLENLEEVSYLDEARLLVVDHPTGMEVHPDERFAVAEPMPQDRFYGAVHVVAPVRAFDDEGGDVLPALLAEDRVTVDGFARDRRFPGLAHPHALVLDFGDRIPPVAPGERLVLYLAGWIEYGYSKTVHAAEQAGLGQEPPVLEVETAAGWTPAAVLGYPAGNPRTMTYDVTGLLGPGRARCRIRTNLEVYWDRIHLARDEAPGRLAVTTILPTAADLHPRGYPREYSPDGRAPTLYDRSVCEAWIPFRTMPGDYTRLGDVTPLLTAADDRFAIFGKGEEITLRFPAEGLPPLEPGRARTFFLRLDGYCKDMDPYTGRGEAVEPLPFHAMSNYPYPASERYPDTPAHREYRARWNTRRVR